MRSRHVTHLACVLVLFWATPALHAQELNLEDQVIEHTLDNGLKILMVERHEVPRVVCHIYYRVGSVNERPGITGISHFHEHMMFKGTRTIGVTDFQADDALNRQIDSLYHLIYREKYWKRDGDQAKIKWWEAQADSLMKYEKRYIIKDDLWETYMKNGGTGLNASTGKEITGYYVTLPSNKVELQMWLESDRMLNPYFREFYSEKEVVREERRLSENSPGYFFREQLNATFWAASPYAWSVVGWDADLQKLTKQDMIEYNRRYYVPNNAVAVYVGDINPQGIIALAEKYFGRIPRGPDPEPVRTTEPKQYCEKRLYGEAEAPPSVTIMYHVPPAGHPDAEVFRVISGLMNGTTGRLYKKLVKEKGIAVEASASGGGMMYDGQYSFSGRPKSEAGHTPEEVEQALYEESELLKKEPVPEYELQKVKNQTEANFVQSLRSTYALAARLGRAELGLGWRDLQKSLERMKAVTAEDIMRVAATYFVKDNRTVGILYRAARTPQGRRAR
ncbi:MAG: pitrilysin family protein [bacterium]|nr:insulinase family protein [candidate division KSB1 bacterium]MDH7560432.1 pitrilysin family protein [bacterium]